MSFCFFLNTYKDANLASLRLKELRGLYSKADIICCSDGIDSVALQTLCDELRVCYFSGQRLKLSRYGGLWVYRMLTLFLLNSQAECLVKLDPDSKVIRQFRSFPDADLFGTYRTTKAFAHINGGCLGISRKACQRIIESDYLNDLFYTSATFSYQRFQPPYIALGEEQSTEFLIGSDLILSHVAIRLGMFLDNWDDVFCSPFQNEVSLDLSLFNDRYAVVHPYKFEDEKARV